MDARDAPRGKVMCNVAISKAAPRATGDIRSPSPGSLPIVAIAHSDRRAGSIGTRRARHKAERRLLI
jgi:hypothetical protein